MDQPPTEDADLERAIQISLKQPKQVGKVFSETDSAYSDVEIRRPNHMLGTDASGKIGCARNESGTTFHDGGDGDDGLDLQAALAESRRSKRQSKNRVGTPSSRDDPTEGKKFPGPLPFEPLNLGQSLLGKKKADKVEEDLAGGFEKESANQKKVSAPLPAWFAASDWTSDMRHRSKNDENGKDVMGQAIRDLADHGWGEASILGEDQQVIDVDKPWQTEPPEQIPIDSSEEETDEGRDGRIQNEMCNEMAERMHSGVQKIEEKNSDDLFHENEYADLLPSDESNRRQHRPTRPRFSKRHPVEDVVELRLKSTVSSPGEDLDDLEGVDDEDEDKGKTIGNKPRQETWEITAGNTGQASSGAAWVSVETEDDEDDFEDVEVHATFQDDATGQKAIDMRDSADVAIKDQEPTLETKLIIDSQAEIEGRDMPEEDFSDSDEELMRQMAVEAEEHARFASSLNHNQTAADAGLGYEKELKQLRNQQKKDRRDADEVTQVMIQECQALLRLFGLPYITAPMEAEAQCAELARLELVDGIVTDDSDIFLFGGTRVYKNMFNAAKFVECYLTADLEQEYGLDRRKLIRCAHLLGSDYTEGIPRIGPVTALEILTEFETLEEFGDWCAKIQMGELEGNITTPFHKKVQEAGTEIVSPFRVPR